MCEKYAIIHDLKVGDTLDIGRGNSDSAQLLLETGIFHTPFTQFT